MESKFVLSRARKPPCRSSGLSCMDLLGARAPAVLTRTLGADLLVRNPAFSLYPMAERPICGILQRSKRVLHSRRWFRAETGKCGGVGIGLTGAAPPMPASILSRPTLIPIPQSWAQALWRFSPPVPRSFSWTSVSAKNELSLWRVWPRQRWHSPCSGRTPGAKTWAEHDWQ